MFNSDANDIKSIKEFLRLLMELFKLELKETPATERKLEFVMGKSKKVKK
jgi:hypothetical protein